jgi:hypothetical protein
VNLRESITLQKESLNFEDLMFIFNEIQGEILKRTSIIRENIPSILIFPHISFKKVLLLFLFNFLQLSLIIILFPKLNLTSNLIFSLFLKVMFGCIYFNSYPPRKIYLK